MAAMSQEGRLASFLVELAGTAELDEFTKGTLSEIARDEALPACGGRLPAPHDRPALKLSSNVGLVNGAESARSFLQVPPR